MRVLSSLSLLPLLTAPPSPDLANLLHYMKTSLFIFTCCLCCTCLYVRFILTCLPRPLAGYCRAGDDADQPGGVQRCDRGGAPGRRGAAPRPGGAGLPHSCPGARPGWGG